MAPLAQPAVEPRLIKNMWAPTSINVPFPIAAIMPQIALAM